MYHAMTFDERRLSCPSEGRGRRAFVTQFWAIHGTGEQSSRDAHNAHNTHNARDKQPRTE